MKSGPTGVWNAPNTLVIQLRQPDAVLTLSNGGTSEDGHTHGKPVTAGQAPSTQEPPDTGVTAAAAGDRHRLTALQGLAALSLDAMASVAYGPESVVLVLAAAGAYGLGFHRGPRAPG